MWTEFLFPRINLDRLRECSGKPFENCFENMMHFGAFEHPDMKIDAAFDAERLENSLNSAVSNSLIRAAGGTRL